MQSDKSKALIDSITLSINNLATHDRRNREIGLVQRLAACVSRFHTILNNQLLVLLQRPQAEACAGSILGSLVAATSKKRGEGKSRSLLVRP